MPVILVSEVEVASSYSSSQLFLKATIEHYPKVLLEKICMDS